MRLIVRFFAFFFHHLYHGLAFTYDAVAAIVSFGQWIEWTKTVLPFIEGTRILELGHGPGHLQRTLLKSVSARSEKSPDFSLVVGLDESSQMGRIARRRLLQSGCARHNLARGLAQSLPFRAETFDSVVSTFPAEYIFDPRTLTEARRVLRDGGRFIVLPAGWPKGRLLAWLYRVTGESPAEAREIVREKARQPFVRAGFETETHLLDAPAGTLLLIAATKRKELNVEEIT